jgi:CheY-like chemotaxis protein
MSANIRILLIEDDQDDIELLQEALKENNVMADFDILMQGNKIVGWLEESRAVPDVAIMDLNLPKLHGREVLTLIKGHEKYRNVPVMVLTTSSQPEEKEYCLSKGAEEFLTKPSTTEGFMEMVKTILKMTKRRAS